MNTFRHAGDRGDIIAALPAIRALGGGVMYIEAATYTREMLTPDRWCGLDKILKEQPYIKDVLEWPRNQTTFNMNDFRNRLFKSVRVGLAKDKSLVDWQLEQYRLPSKEKDTAWLEFKEPIKAARVIFSRSGAGRTRMHTYQNPRFPWHYVWEKYRKHAAFVGTPDEYTVFCATCGKVPHVPTADLYEVARVIAGCDLFVGNQSCCFWLAAGLFKPTVLEIWPEGPNSLMSHPGSVHGWDENVALPDLN
jgi:hypothetical protein